MLKKNIDFYEFILMIGKFRIIEENIYNFNEKKFLIDVGVILVQIIT